VTTKKLTKLVEILDTRFFYVVYHHSNGVGFRALPVKGELNIADLSADLAKEYGSDCIVTSWKEISSEQHAQLLRRGSLYETKHLNHPSK